MTVRLLIRKKKGSQLCIVTEHDVVSYQQAHLNMAMESAFSLLLSCANDMDIPLMQRITELT